MFQNSIKCLLLKCAGSALKSSATQARGGESGEYGEKIIHFISPHFFQKFTAKFTAFLAKIHRICFPTFTQSDLNSQENSR